MRQKCLVVRIAGQDILRNSKKERRIKMNKDDWAGGIEAVVGLGGLWLFAMSMGGIVYLIWKYVF